MCASPLIRATFVVFALLLSRPIAVAAADVDEITIKGGSILKGKIKRVDNDELILDTDYADDVAIDVRHIVEINSIQQYSIRLITGEIISGYIGISNGKIILRETLPAQTIPQAAEIPREIELADTASEAPATTPVPQLEEAEAEISPIALPQLQEALPEDLQAGEMRVEPMEPADTRHLETPNAVVHVDGRELTFDEIDWIREEPSYLRYEADLNVGAQLARGNSDTTDLHFDARFDPSFGWNTIRVSGQYDKKTADGDTTTNRWDASIGYERDFYRRWFVGASNTYESDRQRDLDLRIVAGAGIGYRFFDEDPTFLSVLPGIAYVNENYELADDDTNYVAFRLTIDFKRDLYKDDIKLFHNSLYLNNLQDLSDINVDTRTGIKFDMPWNLVLSAEFQSNWVNEPAEGAKKLDTRYMLKIGFEFEGDETDWFQ